jgi:hypothetical protein
MTTPRTMPTPERLKQVLDFDRATGIFRWRVGRGRAHAGDVAGNPRHSGRWIGLDRCSYRAHDLAQIYQQEVATT